MLVDHDCADVLFFDEMIHRPFGFPSAENCKEKNKRKGNAYIKVNAWNALGFLQHLIMKSYVG